jgi:sigma-54 dependent transcriptional regulator, acetoin dehydrogenase operon transcriptional activator AcoR
MSVTGMYDEEGAFIGVLAAFRDLTEMINLQLRLGELTSFSGIVGSDRRMLDVYEQIRNLAAADYPVHITGDTGTGKELVAAAGAERLVARADARGQILRGAGKSLPRSFRLLQS